MEKNKKQETKQYEYAHLVMHCGKCGSKYILEKDVKGGLQINLPTASNSDFILVCKECKNTMGLLFVESDGDSKKIDNEQDNSDLRIKSAEIVEVEPKMEIVE